ncbi:MAG: amino acid adenylation domain-containing protein [Planctomycetota bacterium]
MSTANLASTIAAPVAVVPGPTRNTYATTEAQLEIWLASQQSVDANCAYNEISSIEFRGGLDQQALRAALESVVKRNASLRSTFSSDGQTVIVHERTELNFRSIDLSKHHAENQLAEQDRVIRDEGTTPFDLVNGPLIRFVLRKIADDHHILTFNAHHIVMDGWSLSVFCRDLGHFYDQIRGTNPAALPPANQYTDYADATQTYMESDQHKADVAFWMDQFSDGAPVVDTPIEFSRPTLKTFRSERHEQFLSSSLAEKLRKLGAKKGCSLFNTVLAAFNAYLSRLTGATDLCVGIPTAGQAAMDQQELIGFCVNTMPLRTTIDVDASFDQVLGSTRTTLLNAFEHQRLSFGTLIRLLAPPRDPSRSPIVDISLNLDPAIDTSELGFDGLTVDVRVEPRCFEKFEWFINGVIHRDQSIELQIQYNADLYSHEAIEFYFEGFEAFLEGIAEDPTRPIGDYHLMSLAQRQRVIVGWNSSKMEYPTDSTLHQEFSRQAVETPDRTAVRFDDRSLTYREVEQRSNQIARFLQRQGVSSGDLVGICVERSEQMLVYLYAILKAGAGYVPLDPAYPADRLQYMCDHSGLTLVVTQESLREQVAEFGKHQIELDQFGSEIDAMETDTLDVPVNPVDICYVIYTSGSTGKPKGVQVPHGAVVNFLYSMQTEPGFGSDDSMLAVTTLSFDIAVLELYLPTVSGGNVVILDGATAANGEQLAEQIERHDISLLQATPATWRLLIQSDWPGKRDLKVLCGGEPMPQDLVGPLLDRCGELWNMYGPTETTVWSAIYQITDANAPILIGKPIGNTQVYLLDKNGNEVPAGCEGELFIGGAGVTLGYRNRDDLTEERFVSNRYRNPFTNYVSDRIYKTGDIARYRFDGNLEFLRRNDKQVKVRGFRIELGEIEQNLKSHPAIQQTVVIVREDSPGDTRLAAYWIAKPDQDASASEFRAHLRQSLPGYMVPHHFVRLDQMPQTNNGKIDYKQLLKPSNESAADADQSREQPSTAAETYFVEICSEALEHDDILLDDTFFDIGGHSLLVMQLITRIESETGIKLGPQDFLVNTTRQLATKLAESERFADLTETAAENASTPEPTAANEEPVESSEPTGNVTHGGEHFMNKLKGFWD